MACAYCPVVKRDVEKRVTEASRLRQARDLKKYSLTPKGRYQQQKWRAKDRGIGWQFSFESWWDMWTKSGHWSDRGTAQNCYVMSRKGDIGPYSPENVFIQPMTDNVSQRPQNKAHFPKGVKAVGRRFRASKCVGGVRYHLGYYATADDASKAYIAGPGTH